MKNKFAFVIDITMSNCFHLKLIRYLVFICKFPFIINNCFNFPPKPNPLSNGNSFPTIQYIILFFSNRKALLLKGFPSNVNYYPLNPFKILIHYTVVLKWENNVIDVKLCSCTITSTCFENFHHCKEDSRMLRSNLFFQQVNKLPQTWETLENSF